MSRLQLHNVSVVPSVKFKLLYIEIDKDHNHISSKEFILFIMHNKTGVYNSIMSIHMSFPG